MQIARTSFLVAVLALAGLLPPVASAVPTQSAEASDVASGATSPGTASLMQGLDLFTKGDLSGAEKALDESTKLDPALVETYLVLAEIRLRQGRLDDAESLVRKALSIKPKAPSTLVALGNIMLLKKDSNQAESMYRKALAINSNHVPAYLGLGELNLRVLGKPKEAIAAYKRACEINPNLASGQYALGSAYAADRQHAEAIKAFQEASRLTPSDPQPLHAIGRIQANDRKLDQAVQSFTAALDANAGYLPALIDRADAQAALGRDREAAADYEKAVATQAGNAQLWLKLGVLKDRLKERDEAIKAYQKAISLNSELPLAYNNLAWLTYGDKTQLDQALEWSRKATTLAPKVPQFHDTLGWIHRARGNLDEARKSLETAARLPPPQADVFYHLGIVLQEQGKAKEAIAALKRALQLDKGFANAADAKLRLGSLAAK